MNERTDLSAPHVTELGPDAILRTITSECATPLRPEFDVFREDLADYSDCRHCIALLPGSAAPHWTVRSRLGTA